MASATNCVAGPIGNRSSTRKSIGCSTAMTGDATTLVSGVTKLILPKVAATKGAVRTVAMVDVTRPRSSAPRHPGARSHETRFASIPEATSATIPTMLSWKPRSVAEAGSSSGTRALTASSAHTDVGRCAATLSETTASIVAARTAGSGAPISATYSVVRAITNASARRRCSPAIRATSETATAISPT